MGPVVAEGPQDSGSARHERGGAEPGARQGKREEGDDKWGHGVSGSQGGSGDARERAERLTGWPALSVGDARVRRGLSGESDARQAGLRGVKHWLRREAGRCGAERWTGPGACCCGPQGRERARAGLVWAVGPRCARLRLWGFGLLGWAGVEKRGVGQGIGFEFEFWVFLLFLFSFLC